jgi:hypothetical protein
MVDTEQLLIFIPHNVPSLKNSKVKTSRGIFASPTVNRYLRLLGIQGFSSSKKIVKGYAKRPNQFEQFRSKFEEMLKNKDFPVLIGFHFVRESKRLFDFGNATEILFDLLTAHDIIPDDSVKYIFPSVMTKEGILPTKENFHQHEWYSVDKDNPGVYITIN